jgi:polyhydroxyalkanoate synthase
VKGDFVLSGRRVDLSKVTAPVLNVFALNDHIIPPTCSRALRAHVGTKDYSEIELPGGHVGLFVSSKSQGSLTKGISEWLSARD